MNNNIIPLFVLNLFFLSLTLVSAAQVSPSKVDSLMIDALAKFKVAGAAIAIVKDGKIVHANGYGVNSVKTNVPVNIMTNFQIASNTKAFTTAALSILVDEGKINWGDKVIKHLPEFKMYNDYVTENFNIVDLVTHRSGLPLGAGDLMFIPDGSDFTVKDVMNAFQYFKPGSAFRTKYDYDNLLYIVAGEVIARASGMSYDSFIQKRIFEPLKMDNSAIGKPIIEKSNYASPHASHSGTTKEIKPFEIGMISAAGGIYSNVADMSKWMILQLNKGKYGNELKSTLYSVRNTGEMWKIHTVLPNYVSERYNTHFNGYGLGWLLNDMKGNLVATHTGGLPGMLSQVTLIPDLNLGIVILTNTEYGGGNITFAVTRAIMDTYFGLDDAGWITIAHDRANKNMNRVDEVTNKVWAKVDSVKNINVPTKNFIGIYEDKWFGKMEVFLKNKQLYVRSLRSPKLVGPMYFYDPSTFAVKWEDRELNCDAFATFSLDGAGKALSMKMKGISPGIDFSFDFHHLDLKRIN